jgi:hypothetical protein
MDSILYVEDRRARFSEEEEERHRDVSVCKSRGGSALLLGARSPGRWDPACSCGWRVFSNEGRREAAQAWGEHRRGAVAEERVLAGGGVIYRVRVAHRVAREQFVREWRAIFDDATARSRAAEEDRSLYHVAWAERSSDGVTWERI